MEAAAAVKLKPSGTRPVHRVWVAPAPFLPGRTLPPAPVAQVNEAPPRRESFGESFVRVIYAHHQYGGVLAEVPGAPVTPDVDPARPLGSATLMRDRIRAQLHIQRARPPAARPSPGLRVRDSGRALEECLPVSIQLSDAAVVALISALGVMVAALITSLGTVIAAWLQNRHGGPS
jgi:hypothetical protein